MKKSTSIKLSKILFLLVILLVSSNLIYAQKTSKNNKIYEIWVEPMNQSEAIKGYLYSANSTSIKIIDNKVLDTTNLITIESKNIDVIKWRRKGSVKKDLSYGLIGGVLIGIIVGLTADLGFSENNSGEDNLAEGVARGPFIIGTTFAYGALGGGLGAVIGTIKKKANIKGDAENYTKELDRLKGICIK